MHAGSRIEISLKREISRTLRIHAVSWKEVSLK